MAVHNIKAPLIILTINEITLPNVKGDTQIDTLTINYHWILQLYALFFGFFQLIALVCNWLILWFGLTGLINLVCFQ